LASIVAFDDWAAIFRHFYDDQRAFRDASSSLIPVETPAALHTAGA
jgi:hypothetical protein